MLFEANIAPGFYTHFDTSLVKYTLLPSLLGNRTFEIGVVISPKVVLRMERRRSNPVRTPSYMPRGILYFMPTKKFTFRSYTRYMFYSVMLSHHSSGQDGPFYNADGSFNYINGDFSTNFFEFSLHLMSLEREGFDVSLGRSSIEWHPGFNQANELEDQQYSYLRYNLYSTIFFPERWGEIKGYAKYSYMLERFEKTERTLPDLPGPHSISLTVIFRHKWMENFGLFANYFRGEDYYNMRFNRTLDVFRLGFVADASLIVSKIGEMN